MEEVFGHNTYYILCASPDKVLGVLPLIHLKSRLFGNILCSMPFLNFGGLVADTMEVERCLLDEAEKLSRKLGVDYTELRHMREIHHSLPQKTHKVSMTIKLDNDPEVLWNNFSSKHRNELRKSFKNGLEFRVGKMDMLDDFYNVLSEGWRDLGTPIYNRYFFDKIVQELEEHIELTGVYHENTPIAVAFNGLFKDTVEGMWTYALPRYRHLRSNYFLYWKMIERACEAGFNIYHLGRSSKDSGNLHFKNKWNAFPQQLYWDFILHKKTELPSLDVDNPKYKMLIKTWQTMPVRLTQIIGPPIARSIP